MASAYSSTSLSVSENRALFRKLGNASIFSAEVPLVLLTAEPMSVQNGHPTSVATRQGRLHQLAGEKRLFHLAVAPQKLGVMCGDLHRHHHAPHLALRHRIEDSRK